MKRLRRSTVSFLLFTLLLTSTAFAQSIDVARWFGKELGNRAVISRYSLDIYTDSDVEEQDSDLGLMEHDFFLMAPVWQNERNEVGITAKVELQDTDTDAVLPREGIPRPEHDRRGRQSLWGGQNRRPVLDLTL